MRREMRWGLVAVVTLGLGAAFARPYVRLIAPFDGAVARWVAIGHPWQVTSVAVGPSKSGLTKELQLHASVHTDPPDGRAAYVTGRIQVGEVVETPLVFWTLLLAWPFASLRQRLMGLAVGVPLFLLSEAIITGTEFTLSMAQASALLTGDSHSPLAWERWSRLLEAGGGFVVALFAALLTVAIVRVIPRPQP